MQTAKRYLVALPIPSLDRQNRPLPEARVRRWARIGSSQAQEAADPPAFAALLKGFLSGASSWSTQSSNRLSSVLSTGCRWRSITPDSSSMP